MRVDAVVGGQYGSEGKGAILAHIAGLYDASVRVGAANAGHTLYTRDLHAGDCGDPSCDPKVQGMPAHVTPWQKHVMQQIPCSAYAAPEADLYLGPGALISPEIFEAELDLWHRWCRDNGYERKPVFVDHRAHIVTIEQQEREQSYGLEQRIGSTSATAKEGIGMAQADRVMRMASCVTAAQWFDSYEWFGRVVLMDVPKVLAESAGSRHRRVPLEGTQGTGLSLTTGAFPYTTSRNTTVAGLLADCGIAPRHLENVILVVRTYPIRVAGNSGPFFADSEEINWSDIGVDPETERTTVTKKVRRVATFSLAQVVEAVRLNGATEIALTFADYVCPEIAGIHGSWSKIPEGIREDVLYKLRHMIDDIEKATGVRVSMLGTGPHSVISMEE